MTDTLAHHLQPVASRLDPRVGDPAALRRVIALADELPPVADVVLEMRLNTAVRQIDLSLCMPVAEAHYNAFVAGRAPAGGQGHPGWTGLRQVMAACADPATLPGQSTRLFWLEFDVDRTPPGQQLPGYYVDIHALDRRHAYAREHTAVSHKVGLAQELFKLALARPWDEQHGAFLAHCFDSLPAGAVVAYLGNMLPRGETVTRYAVRGLPIGRLPAYLGALGWRYDATPLIQQLAPLRDVADLLVFNFAAEGAALTPRIDVECLAQGINPPRWREILGYLAGAGFCSAAQVNGLLQWPGISHLSDNGAPARGLLGRLQPVIHRGINHLKLVFRPDQPLELKAYLACRRVWLDRARYYRAPVEIGAAS